MTTLAIAALLQALPVEELRTGTMGGPLQAGNLVIRDRAAFEALWKSATPADTEIPDVDFATSTVVAVLGGRAPTAGYRVRVTAITIKDGEARVTVERKVPEGPAATVITSPFCIVKTSKLPDKVHFSGPAVD